MATDAIHVVSEMRYQAESYFACKTAMFMMIVQQWSLSRVYFFENKVIRDFYKVAQLSFPRENNVWISKSELLRTV